MRHNSAYSDSTTEMSDNEYSGLTIVHAQLWQQISMKTAANSTEAGAQRCSVTVVQQLRCPCCEINCRHCLLRQTSVRAV